MVSKVYINAKAKHFEDRITCVAAGEAVCLLSILEDAFQQHTLLYSRFSRTPYFFYRHKFADLFFFTYRLFSPLI